MSKIFDQFLSKLFAIFAILIFISAFRETILTDSSVSSAFGNLMGILPFAKIITDIVCNILGCQYKIPIYSTTSAITDLIRLAFMSCLEPLVIGILTVILLPIPQDKDYKKQEEYMETFAYKLKELVLRIFCSPALAVFSAQISKAMLDYLNDSFSNLISNLIGIIVTVILGGVSVVFLSYLAKITILKAIKWRLIITFAVRMLKTFIINTLCIAVYVSFLRGIKSEIATSLISLIVMLIIMDFVIKNIQQCVVSPHKKNI